MKKFLTGFTVIFTVLVSTALAYADIGVGIGTGKIVVDQKLKPGTIYELPSLTVFNTGTVTSEYEINIAYHEKQPQLRPPQSWFILTPKTFTLKPGKSQEVKIKLNLPVKTEPGEYFAYLEGHPTTKGTNGTTSVGIAAAAKLYFTVIPGSFFEGIYYKIISFWHIYDPWPRYSLIAVGVIIGIILAKKFLNIEINLKKKK